MRAVQVRGHREKEQAQGPGYELDIRAREVTIVSASGYIKIFLLPASPITSHVPHLNFKL